MWYPKSWSSSPNISKYNTINPRLARISCSLLTPQMVEAEISKIQQLAYCCFQVKYIVVSGFESKKRWNLKIRVALMATWFIIFPVTTGCWGMTSAAWQRVSEEAKVRGRARARPRVRAPVGFGSPRTWSAACWRWTHWNAWNWRTWEEWEWDDSTSLEYVWNIFGIFWNRMRPKSIGKPKLSRRDWSRTAWCIPGWPAWPSFGHLDSNVILLSLTFDVLQSTKLLMHLMLRWDLVEWFWNLGAFPWHDSALRRLKDSQVESQGCLQRRRLHALKKPIPVDSCFWLQAEAIQV